MKVGNCLACTMHQSCINLMLKNYPAPTIFNNSTGVPFSFFLSFDLGKKHNIVSPGDLSNKLLDNFRVNGFVLATD